MDLKRLSVRAASSKGAVLHIKDPITGDDLYDGDDPVTITILGTESDQLRDKLKEIEKRKAHGEEISAEQTGAEMLATLTTGWSGIGLGSTEPLEFTFENAVKLYLDPDAEWIIEQVRPFSRSRRNFLGNRQKG